MSKQNSVQENYEKEFFEMVGELSVERWGGEVTVGNNTYTVLEVVKLAVKRAADKATSAAYGGSMGDGGALSMVHSIQSWIAGLERTLPPGREFGDIAKQLTKEHNPNDWAEYNRLKKVFEGA
jgi:hypothetical protein